MRGALLIAVALFFTGCPRDEGARPPPPQRDGRLGKQRCTGKPGVTNKKLAVFQSPFDGAFPALQFFDHQTPGEYRAFDMGSNQLSYCGVELLGAPEGYEGYLWAMPVGTPIFPVADGVVTAAGVEPDAFCPLTKEIVSGQQVVEVRHDGLGGIGFVTTYRHLSQVLVKTGDKVETAKRLGLSGKSGCATEPVLYFSVKRLSGTKNGKAAWVDPYGWDGPAQDPWAAAADGAASLYLWKDGEAPGLGTR